MRQFQAKFYIITRGVLIALFLVVLIFLSVQKLVLSDVFECDSDSNFVQGLYPEGRVISTIPADCNVSYCNESAVVIAEPVYYDVYMPKRFDKVKMFLTYKKVEDLDVKLGVKLNVNDYAFYFHDLSVSGDGFVTEEFEFDLSQVEIVRNKVKFIVSAPGVSEGDLILGGASFVFKN